MNNKTKVYMSVISHNQEKLIMEHFNSLDFENEEFDIKLILIDNTNSEELKNFADEKGYQYFADEKTRGFGENHNKAFEVSQAKDNDIFIVCNPDVILEEEQLFSMLKNFIIKKREFSNVTCYYDREKKILSNPDRHFPCFLNFVFSIAFQKRFHYGTNTNVTNPEWISGEFFLITANTYKKLNGFDDDYFMYVEDIDLCYRAKKLGITIFHDKEFYIIHETQMASRNLLSSSFKMHLSSVFRYLVKNKIFCLLKKVP